MSTSLRGVLVWCLCLGLFARPGAAAGQSSAITSFTVTSSHSADREWTAGWEFSISDPIEVTHLGVFDGTNFIDPSDVAIWTTGDVPVQMAYTQVSPGDELLGGFHYRAITPVLLGAGTYRIGALMNVSVSGPYDLEQTAHSGNGTFDTRITWLGAKQSAFGTGFQYPSDGPRFSEDPYGVIGPNFRFNDPQADPVPEPALIQLPALLALGGLGYLRRRRRAA